MLLKVAMNFYKYHHLVENSIVKPRKLSILLSLTIKLHYFPRYRELHVPTFSHKRLNIHIFSSLLRAKGFALKKEKVHRSHIGVAVFMKQGKMDCFVDLKVADDNSARLNYSRLPSSFRHKLPL